MYLIYLYMKYIYVFHINITIIIHINIQINIMNFACNVRLNAFDISHYIIYTHIVRIFFILNASSFIYKRDEITICIKVNKQKFLPKYFNI